MRQGLVSSESVSEGHPDKLAYRISDRVLDAFSALDPKARVACETLIADQCVVVASEFRTTRHEDFQAVRDSIIRLVREVHAAAGHRDAATGIDPD
jgi:S-adenosylmethionine synthetase